MEIFAIPEEEKKQATPKLQLFYCWVGDGASVEVSRVRKVVNCKGTHQASHFSSC